ncbi:hypothetical protein A2533_00735 [Candidatus Falkowbacteria bacterium RIFOXYD2_FULL_35_9]|uniref:Uncharacterized protein n=1 Tax=Candidatus Falkowbacteria bacterium RIFOXYC2_FULL_36_12 TaxID=1798002 RepID=A0A1F5T3P6_9BACT|nr:MAG: hypothetical protein A2300_04355 [Candidatus Falkowbacteria bacterium RIFOXYB2_FULL_35_7]OGF33082.1 MAG: hypothetical protein A2223_05090 [Candidatus Falkowbacteria bacterium RIFOXYA2_FULL_35_8]OGF33356.1 MAG: hypothetical protein A2478_01490 [Candidatus Falkowbacteria bacterium RIFOXYC2_FULL_36_12]OGF45601.1 MAG: hypothetical protein A2533_00735 [Candidatus Falkowbacteria bacterium RIFOXYD2_FULL_35_9]
MDFEKYKKVYIFFEKTDLALNVIAYLLFFSGFYFTIYYPVGSLMVAGMLFFVKLMLAVFSSYWIGRKQITAIVETKAFFQVLSWKKNDLLKFFGFELFLLIVVIAITAHNLINHVFEDKIVFYRAGFSLLVILSISSSVISFFRVRSIIRHYNQLAINPSGDTLQVSDLDPNREYSDG